MTDRRESLATLYARFDAIAKRRASGNSSTAHQAVVTRLEANRKLAEACGWTACDLERQGGSGRLRLWGTPPSAGGREIVPDSSGALEQEPGPDAEGSKELGGADERVAPTPPPMRPILGGTRLLGTDVAWGADARWLNEGGR